jgi:hypothetical protein
MPKFWDASSLTRNGKIAGRACTSIFIHRRRTASRARLPVTPALRRRRELMSNGRPAAPRRKPSLRCASEEWLWREPWSIALLPTRCAGIAPPWPSNSVDGITASLLNPSRGNRNSCYRDDLTPNFSKRPFQPFSREGIFFLVRDPTTHHLNICLHPAGSERHRLIKCRVCNSLPAHRNGCSQAGEALKQRFPKKALAM